MVPRGAPSMAGVEYIAISSENVEMTASL